MNILRSLFRKKVKPDIEYKENWNFYISNIEDKIGSIFLDLGLRNIAPLKNQKNMVYISIQMNFPTDNGLSSDIESTKLYEIEDKIIDDMNEYLFTYVGRVTSNFKRDIFIYTGESNNIIKSITNSMELFPEYKYELKVKNDPNWSTYLNYIFPTPQEYQTIQNSLVVENLIKHGDRLETARLVDHWIYFKKSNDREKFLELITNDNFNIISMDFDSSLGTYPYRLQINREDLVDIESVNNYVLRLWNLAKDVGGEYDGWETVII